MVFGREAFGRWLGLNEVISVEQNGGINAQIRKEGQQDPSLPMHVHWGKAMSEWTVIYKSQEEASHQEAGLPAL